MSPGTDSVTKLVDEALRVAREREETLARLREALLQGKIGDALTYAGRLTGLTEQNGRFVE